MLFELFYLENTFSGNIGENRWRQRKAGTKGHRGGKKGPQNGHMGKERRKGRTAQTHFHTNSITLCV